jgi:hypothetical protein
MESTMGDFEENYRSPISIQASNRKSKSLTETFTKRIISNSNKNTFLALAGTVKLSETG